MRTKLTLIMAALALLIAIPVSAAKPAANLAGVQKVDWNLSGAVMPVPPYGSQDIPGSDNVSKLLVNQPNGNTQGVITGVMKGLLPDTTYTVYLSKPYTPYTYMRVASNWTWNVLNGAYLHDMTINSFNPLNGTFSGTGVWPKGTDRTGTFTDETITGQITGNQMTFTVTYLGPYSPGSVWTVTGTIQNDGSVTGNIPWIWSTSPGTVIPASGSTGWPGLYSSAILPITFVTDSTGSGSFHINLKAADLPATENPMSVWINGAGRTILISDTFTITK